ncbi:lantibiotic dehydratase [Streptomyces sp. H27-H1]|uniref:lantibiotic dehydratase n=1 Tax=Streptomyces sp. H27-H1 TaxID=2996461 RepID=UPI00226E7E1B|nr:lantibiotic dehydratase [Streptomyces sp. H27-H1]MCY0932102.1 lantibiotic dehydratase [Streptomyces sp. H27-H1]
MAVPAGAYRGGRVALVRAAAQPAPPAPHHLPLTAPATVQADWLRAVWADETFAESLRHASPSLARQIDTLCNAQAEPMKRDLRRAVVSVSRYLLRAAARATPFGLFAGVTTAAFSSRVHAQWGSGHQAVVRAGAEWLAEVVTRLEGFPELLVRLPVVTNNTVVVRGEQLIVPHQPQPRDRRTAAVDVCIAYKAPVRVALAAARTPVLAGDLAAKLAAEFPTAGEQEVTGLIALLVRHGALVSGLRAPGTRPDALACLMEQLEAAGAQEVEAVAPLVAEIGEVREAIEACNRAPSGRAAAARRIASARMVTVAEVRRHPLAVDLRLDASLALPHAVAEEAARAAAALARLSAAPYGPAGWKAYHMRFYERFGIGSLVSVADVVDDSGIGYPDAYGADAAPERRPALNERDAGLLRLAQRAALDGTVEVVIDEALLGSLSSGPGSPRLPPHLEVGVRVHAADTAALERGVFMLEVLSVSRGAGVSTGRFLSALDQPGAEILTADLANLPTGDTGTIPVQLSYPPLDPRDAHVTRTPRVLPTLVSVGEHHPADEQVLGVDDVAVGCDGTRIYLAAPALGVRIEPVAMHALNLHGHHAPPLARFLCEVHRSQYAQVTTFDWGAAASLPFLPRLRYERTVLSPARWRLEPGEAPPGPGWEAAFADWRRRYRLPRHVYLTEGDRRLALDLDVQGHRMLLSLHMERGEPTVLTEAGGELGWCQGRAHEVVIPLKATAPARWPALPAPSPARVIGRGRSQVPAASRVLLASLYGDLRRQDTILARHLPRLLNQLGSPRWWYMRFRDPDQHLRLRIELPDPTAFGNAAHTVSSWAVAMNEAGLLREIRYPTSYPETGRWGSGAAWSAAEAFFRADSHALLTQFREPARPGPRALAAAHMLSIACAFHGSTTAGTSWLIDHLPATAPARIPRHEFNEAVRCADPRGTWRALRSMPGGIAISDAWKDRDRTLAAYRSHLPGPDTDAIDPDAVLSSLLHCHFVRAVRIDFDEEAVCLYLARAAALAFRARTTGGST